MEFTTKESATVSTQPLYVLVGTFNKIVAIMIQGDRLLSLHHEHLLQYKVNLYGIIFKHTVALSYRVRHLEDFHYSTDHVNALVAPTILFMLKKVYFPINSSKLGTRLQL